MIKILVIMIDVALLREQPEHIKKKIADKKADPALIDSFLAIDTAWKTLGQRIDENRRRQKELSAAREIDQAQRNKEEIKKQEEEIAILEKERELILRRIPNIADDSVPVGSDESENQVIRTWGTPPVFDFEVKDHMELGEQLGIIDTARAGNVSGSRFCYLKGDAALLEFALITHALNVLTNQTILKGVAEKLGSTISTKPFMPVVPPVMIRPSVFIRMGRLDP
ncbi:MAG: seryl-tRNA synthetase, seryl-tRNA synthetase, partial [Candidatus Parcubacteria bacterium]